ncbi:MAG: gamma-glutamylcyclotransferase [Paracoccaceae bacterium]|nr:MAG: gamma-glutamylcyclotransferase [Paracoccaceae bacterium]
MTERLFCFASLVNRTTHGMTRMEPAQLIGWRRVWVHTVARRVAYLTMRPAEGVTLGLLAEVPDGDWAALDLRQLAYDRVTVTADTAAGPVACHLYVVPEAGVSAPAAAHPILLSYVDCIVQGYMQAFGAEGVARFFAETDGWDAQVLNDRAEPRYRRARVLTAQERAAVDEGLAGTAARIIG